MSFSSDSTAQSRPVYEQVIYAVANANGVDPTDLDPLYDTIDPDALDSLFGSGTEGTIAFAYEGHDVAVNGDDTVAVDGTKVDLHTHQAIGVSDDSEASAAGQ